MERARCDGAQTIGPHTSPIMHTALTMYRRLGFELHETIGHRHGVPYATYRRSL